MVREAEEGMVVLSSMTGGVYYISSRIGGGSALGMGIVSNPVLFDLYSDEKGLRLLHIEKSIHTCTFPRKHAYMIRGVSDVPPRDKVE